MGLFLSWRRLSFRQQNARAGSCRNIEASFVAIANATGLGHIAKDRRTDWFAALTWADGRLLLAAG